MFILHPPLPSKSTLLQAQSEISIKSNYSKNYTALSYEVYKMIEMLVKYTCIICLSKYFSLYRNGFVMETSQASRGVKIYI